MDEGVEGEAELLLGHDVEDDELVAAVVDVLEGLEEAGGVAEQVADHDDDAARGDALGDLVEDGRELRLAADLGRVDEAEEVEELALARLGGEEFAYARVERREPHAVLLADEHRGEARGEVLGVLELGEAAALELGGQVAAVVHRAGAVEAEHDADVGLGHGLLDVVAVLAAVDLPVDHLDLVAREVLAVVGELDGGALLGAAVAAGDEAVHGRAAHELAAVDRGRRRDGQPLHEGGEGGDGHGAGRRG